MMHLKNVLRLGSGREGRRAASARRRPSLEALEGRALLTLSVASPLTIGSTGLLLIQKIALDPQGDTFITGELAGSANFDPDPSHPAHTLSSGGNSAFVAKYSPTNALIWARQFQSAGGSAGGTDLAIDPTSGSVYVSGIFFGKVNFDAGNTNFTLDSGANIAGFLVKLTADGNLDPVAKGQEFSGTGTASATGVALDPSGQFAYLTGAFTGTASLGAPSAGNTFTSPSAGTAADSFVVKVSTSSLGEVWHLGAGLPSSIGGPIAVIGSTGDVVIAGTEGAADSTTELDTAYVETISPAGNSLHVASFGGKFNDVMTANSAEVGSTLAGRTLPNGGLATDSAGNIYVTGSFRSNLTVNSSTGGFTLNNAGGSGLGSGQDAFLIKFDPSLNAVWGRGLDSTNVEAGFDLVIDGSNNLYMGGILEGPANFGTTNGGGTIIASTDTTKTPNAFLLKVDTNGNLLDSAVASGTGTSGIETIAANPSGRVAVAGNFQGSTTLGTNTLQASPGSLESIFAGFLGTSPGPGPGPGPGPVAPVFLGETRVVISTGKHHQKQTLYKLKFSSALNPVSAQNGGLYHVSQATKGHGKHAVTKYVPVGVNSATVDASGTIVTLYLGSSQKNQALQLIAAGLVGANNAPVASFSTGL